MKPPLVLFTTIGVLLTTPGLRAATDCDASHLLQEYPERRFSQELLANVAKTADSLMKLTNESDMLVFLGRSPLYIAEALEAKGARRQIRRIAISTAPYYRSDPPTRVQLLAFRDYMERNGVTPKTIAQTPGRVYLVDFVLTGETIKAFKAILIDWERESGGDGRAVTAKLSVVKLVKKATGSGGEIINPMTSPRLTLPLIGITVDFRLLQIANSQQDASTLGIRYPPQLWGVVDPDGEEPSEAARKFRRQVLRSSAP